MFLIIEVQLIEVIFIVGFKLTQVAGNRGVSMEHKKLLVVIWVEIEGFELLKKLLS